MEIGSAECSVKTGYALRYNGHSGPHWESDI
jgi:hypothetical protein